MLSGEEDVRIEFDHIPEDDELKGLNRQKVEVRFNSLPTALEIERIIKINPVMHFTFDRMISEKELMILAGITFQVEVEKINFVVDTIPEEHEIANIGRVRFNPETKVEISLILFNIPDYTQRKKVRALAMRYPLKLYIFLEKLPDYNERKDLRMIYPPPLAFFLLDYVPGMQEIIEMKRIRPYPLLNIYLEHFPAEEEIKLMKSLEMRFSLYFSMPDDITEGELSLLNFVNAIFQVTGKGEAVEHIFHNILNASMNSTA